MTINKHEQKLSDKFKNRLTKLKKHYSENKMRYWGLGALIALTAWSRHVQSEKLNNLIKDSQITPKTNLTFGGTVRHELQYASNKIEEISNNLLSSKYDSENELQKLYYEVTENLDKFKNKTLNLKEEKLYSKTLVYAEHISNEIKRLLTNKNK